MKYTLPDYDINQEWRPEQHFQRIDKYANYLWEEGRLETWEETITRVVEVLRTISGNRFSSLIYQRMFELLYMGEIAPSMRLMAMSEEAIQRDNTVIYNCSFGLCDRPEIFAEALYIGMSGCGVAFSVEKRNIEKLPVVAPSTGRVYQWAVPDTQEGWAESVKQLTYALYNGDDIEFDYSEIRPSGAPLKIKGGFASGPEPLETIHNAMRRIFSSAQNRQLTSLEVYDLMNWMLEAGISGATRRSAGLVLFDADDDDLLNAKYPGFWNHPEHKVRANSNNTVVYEKEMTSEDFDRVTSPWFNGLGEPGLFRRDNAIRNAPEWREFPDPDYVGINSCFAAGTMVQTRNGHFPIESLVGRVAEVWNGSQWVTIDNFRVTNENQEVFKITLHDGSEIVATDYHKFILEDGTVKLLKELQIGDKLQITEAPDTHGNLKINGAYFKGFMVGDGTLSQDRVYPILYLYEPKYICKERLENSLSEIEPIQYGTYERFDIVWGQSPSKQNRQTLTGVSCRRHEINPFLQRKNGLPEWIFAADYESKLEFIAGLFDADGTASQTANGYLYQYSSVHLQLLKDIQLLLKTIGVQSTLRLNKEVTVKDFNDGYGEYPTQNLYRLTINQSGSIVLSRQVKFTRLFSFADKELKYNTKPRWNRIASIEFSHTADEVYCCTVPGTHQFSLSCKVNVRQCGEISLSPSPIDGSVSGGGWHFCNLTAVHARPHDTVETLEEKVFFATLIGDIQSLATNFQFLSEGTKKICDRDRLLGVSLIGYAVCPVIRDVNVLRHLRTIAEMTDRLFATQFGVPRSAAITTVKPSGNSSQLYNTTPGANVLHAPFIFRHYTVNKNSSMHKFLEDNGVERFDYAGRDYASWFRFPIAYGEALTLENTDAIGQLEIWKKHTVDWCHHNTSCSITYNPGEEDAIKEWLEEHQNIINALAFFPVYHSYGIAPIQTVSKEEYQSITQPFIDWSKYEKYASGVDERTKTVECGGGACEIVYR